MRHYFLLIPAFSLLMQACSKSNSASKKCDETVINIAKQQGYNEFKLAEGQYDPYGMRIVKATYNGQLVYYYHSTCNPASCSFAPVSWWKGINCAGDTIRFTDPSRLKNIEAIFTGKRESCDDFYISKMKKKWETVSSCSPEFKHYLGKGLYLSGTIYFTSISCWACNVAPPQYGVNCMGDSIKIDNWNHVSDTRIIATCRDL